MAERTQMFRELIKTCFFSFTRINTLIDTSFRVLWVEGFWEEKWRIRVPIGKCIVHPFRRNESRVGKIEKSFL